MTKEEKLLQLLFGNLDFAYNAEFHTYDYKLTNQVIRQFFENKIKLAMDEYGKQCFKAARKLSYSKDNMEGIQVYMNYQDYINKHDNKQSGFTRVKEHDLNNGENTCKCDECIEKKRKK